MITLRQVSKSYNTNSPVLNSVNLQLRRGNFLFVVGDSGAGKTTLLQMLTGEEAPTEGKASYNGTSLDSGKQEIRKLHRRMGIVYQDYRLLDDRTVLENVSLPLLFGRAGTGVLKVNPLSRKAKKIALDVLKAVDLPEKYLNVKVSELSGGEQQRICVARAIINFPDVLIAAEPTGNLDHDHTWSIIDLLQKLNLRGMSVIIATHDRDIVRKIRKPTCHLKNGDLRFDEREGACIF